MCIHLTSIVGPQHVRHVLSIVREPDDTSGFMEPLFCGEINKAKSSPIAVSVERGRGKVSSNKDSLLEVSFKGTTGFISKIFFSLLVLNFETTACLASGRRVKAFCLRTGQYEDWLLLNNFFFFF